MFNKVCIFILFSILVCSCTNKLTKAISKDFPNIYTIAKDSFHLQNIAIEYPAFTSAKNTVLQINIQYFNEDYDSIVMNINSFDNTLLENLTYFKNFKYRVYSVNTYTSPKNGNHNIIKTNIKVLKALGTTKFEYDPKRFSSETYYQYLKDSIRNK